MKKKPCSLASKSFRQNLLFTIVILLLAAAIGIGYAISHAKNAASRMEAVVRYTAEGQVYTIALPLDRDETYSIITESYTVHVQVKEGAAAFVDSPCLDHLCEEFGWLSEENAWAACAPAGAILQIEKAVH